jgi:hypothetical protein
MERSPLVVVRKGREGRMVEIAADVQNIAAEIKRVDPRLGVQYNELSEQFRIYELGRDGKRRTVMWVRELTADIPEHLRRLATQDYVREMDRRDARADRDRDHRLHELLGPIGEKLAHAARKDRQVKNKIYVPGWVK